MRGELFIATYSFAGIGLIKLASSIITTRILYPEAYGIVSMIAAVAFVLDMMSDLGAMTLMVRHEKAEQPEFINTAWTLRLIRGITNATLLLLLAPVLADFYETPALAPALRLYAVCFVLDGLESMAFMLAIRHQRSSLFNLCELFSVAVTTAASIGLALLLRNHYAIVLGMILHRVLMTSLSHCFYREHRPRVQIDRAAAVELFQITKFVLPSSVLTLLMTQYDKVIFLKLFDLRLLGLYGLALNIVLLIDGRLFRLSRTMLFPRCADVFRRAPATLREHYYSGNRRFHALILAAPACLGGLASLLVTIAFDHRYHEAGFILTAFAVRSVLYALASSAEALLLAIGRINIGLIGNAVRFAWLIAASLIGYSVAGFEGFVYGVASEPLGALIVYLALQHRERLLDMRREVLRWAYASGIFVALYVLAEVAVRPLLFRHM